MFEYNLPSLRKIRMMLSPQIAGSLQPSSKGVCHVAGIFLQSTPWVLEYTLKGSGILKLSTEYVYNKKIKYIRM